MINYDSIISAYNDKPTLMEWLKKVEEALKGASATSFSVNKKGNATISFQIDFEDGTSLESGDIVLQQGESVQSAAIVNGHLILTLTNGDELDAGSVGAVSGFSIDASQHLIVTYQDGTTNDLGAIFNGNVNISGDLNATGKISGGEIVETMSGYSMSKLNASHWTSLYSGAVKNGNKLTFAVSGKFDYASTTTPYNFEIMRASMPQAIADKIVAAYGTTVCSIPVNLYTGDTASVLKTIVVKKDNPTENKLRFSIITTAGLTEGSTYYFRFECTFLLSNPLIVS